MLFIIVDIQSATRNQVCERRQFLLNRFNETDVVVTIIFQARFLIYDCSFETSIGDTSSLENVNEDHAFKFNRIRNDILFNTVNKNIDPNLLSIFRIQMRISRNIDVVHRRSIICLFHLRIPCSLLFGSCRSNHLTVHLLSIEMHCSLTGLLLHPWIIATSNATRIFSFGLLLPFLQTRFLAFVSIQAWQPRRTGTHITFIIPPLVALIALGLLLSAGHTSLKHEGNHIIDRTLQQPFLFEEGGIELS